MGFLLRWLQRLVIGVKLKQLNWRKKLPDNQTLPVSFVNRYSCCVDVRYQKKIDVLKKKSFEITIIVLIED
jgi:hypothetical protein